MKKDTNFKNYSIIAGLLFCIGSALVIVFLCYHLDTVREYQETVNELQYKIDNQNIVNMYNVDSLSHVDIFLNDKDSTFVCYYIQKDTMKFPSH